MALCRLCGRESALISKGLEVCAGCIKENPENAMPITMEAHARSRAAFGLPARPPDDPQGRQCRLCVNECRIPKGGTGYCGLRKNQNGKLIGVSPEEGKLSWYHDPLPTNCVGDWVCAGGTGAGYPQYACLPGPEYGHKNLAVFFHACSFDCLFCQNWHFRRESLNPYTTPAGRLVHDVDEATSCVCYFGGDPAPQIPFSLRASRLALEKTKGRIFRICWETNGSMAKGMLARMLDTALETGGCVKFDLKAWDENLHRALTGVTNRRTLDNFAYAAGRAGERPVPPPVVASTLLVPGYVEEEEVQDIARFVAGVRADIPLSLLAFHPQFCMDDLPVTSRAMAERCLGAAVGEGLERVRLGNVHLLR